MRTPPPVRSISRRRFLGVSGFSLAAVAFSPTTVWTSRAHARPQPAGTTWFKWEKLSDRAFVASGEGGNVLVVLGSDQAIVIDAKNPGFGRTIRREAEALGKPVRTLINTHHHFDHVGGNPAFTSDCSVIAHANARTRFEPQLQRLLDGGQGSLTQVGRQTRAGKDQVLADVRAFLDAKHDVAAFTPTRFIDRPDGESEKLEIGGVKIELTHVGNGHTDNDLIVYLPDEDILHGGDLLFHRVWPFVDRPGGFSSEGWIKSCERMLEIAGEKTTVVPGHGEVSDRGIAQTQRQIFTMLREQAAAAVRNGETREKFIARPYAFMEDYAAADWIKPITLGGVYDEAAKAPL